MRTRILTGLVVFSLMTALPVLGQSPTGTISGHLADQSGGVLPGVTITAASGVLQGVRTAVTTENGDYLIPLLPPGDYTVTFEISGFQTVRRTIGLSGTQTVTLNETMTVSQLAEEVTVVGGAETFTQTMQIGAKLKQDLVATLPSNRSLDAAILLFPGVHPTGPSGGYSISGAVSYEGLYTVNGVAVTENLRGQPIHLYIEDALQETTITASGVSAEFGRFGGGMVGAVTKSGGNQFSGSYRQSFNNDSWRTKTPFANDVKTDSTIPDLRVHLWWAVDDRPPLVFQRGTIPDPGGRVYNRSSNDGALCADDGREAVRRQVDVFAVCRSPGGRLVFEGGSAVRERDAVQRARSGQPRDPGAAQQSHLRALHGSIELEPLRRDAVRAKDGFDYWRGIPEHRHHLRHARHRSAAQSPLLVANVLRRMWCRAPG